MTMITSAERQALDLDATDRTGGRRVGAGPVPSNRFLFL